MSKEFIQGISPREFEARLLPEDPSRLTFRGRYDHLDAYVAASILDKIPKGARIRILEFGGGVLPSGSPTTHDLYETILHSEHIPVATVVDNYIPSNLSPIYPDIDYRR